MENGRGTEMEVEDTLGYFDCESSAVLPGDVVFFVLKVGPKRSFSTVF